MSGRLLMNVLLFRLYQTIGGSGLTGASNRFTPPVMPGDCPQAEGDRAAALHDIQIS
jgi:hypothetical protein